MKVVHIEFPPLDHMWLREETPKLLMADLRADTQQIVNKFYTYTHCVC